MKHMDFSKFSMPCTTDNAHLETATVFIFVLSWWFDPENQRNSTAPNLPPTFTEYLQIRDFQYLSIPQ